MFGKNTKKMLIIFLPCNTTLLNNENCTNARKHGARNKTICAISNKKNIAVIIIKLLPRFLFRSSIAWFLKL